MAFERADHLIQWSWLQRLFPDSPKHAERDNFAKAALGYLSNPISFENGDGKTIYLMVRSIEPLESAADQQISFEFTISMTPPPVDHRPIVGKPEFGTVTTRIAIGGSERSPAVFGYTFTNLKTLDENKDSLCQFVLLQQAQEGFDLLLGE